MRFSNGSATINEEKLSLITKKYVSSEKNQKFVGGLSTKFVGSTQHHKEN
jgi:hypothetical protein